MMHHVPRYLIDHPVRSVCPVHNLSALYTVSEVTGFPGHFSVDYVHKFFDGVNFQMCEHSEPLYWFIQRLEMVLAATPKA